MRTRGVVAQIDGIEKFRLRFGRRGIGTRGVRVAEIGELAHVTLAAEGTSDTHGVAGLQQEWKPVNAGWAVRPAPSRREDGRWRNDRADRLPRPRAVRRAQSGARSTSPRRVWP